MSAPSAIDEATRTVTMEAAKAHWADLIARVKDGEEWFIVNADGRMLAKLTPATPEPAPAAERWKAFGMLKGQIEFLPGYDEPLDEFAPYS